MIDPSTGWFKMVQSIMNMWRQYLNYYIKHVYVDIQGLN